MKRTLEHGRRPRIVVRELAGFAEFHEAVHVEKEAWQFDERELSPASDLIAATHAGGLTAGVFEGARLLGFVHGIPRTNAGEPCLHSHLLAVRPEAQGRGLSLLLKFYQRRWCLERGIRLVTWTYDPFLLKNARLNLVRLRATVRTFLPNFYGPMGGIYGRVPTDRFEVTWRLLDPTVERAAAAGGGADPSPREAAAPAAAPGRIPSARRVALPFPAGAPGLYVSDPEKALVARRSFARTVTALLSRGYEATGVAVRATGPAYLLQRR